MNLHPQKNYVIVSNISNDSEEYHDESSIQGSMAMD
ncbi:hypothetical protein SDC9_78085 [bioreactor metagenome]|uniref:Uncharacterized protein n=1 Tax=bioreactor metagenome TaxID=1076179 RepID=A0A644YSK9_9ZZZZ